MRVLQLDTTQIIDKPSLSEQVTALMNYPGWYEENVHEWIDLVTLGQQINPNLARFSKAKPELFMIELMESFDFFDRKRNLFKLLLETTTNVNEHAVAKIGYPLISLTMR